MSIEEKDIEKYIFDTMNPKQCKAYKLLLRIAKKDNFSFFSPGFLQFFFGDEVLNDEFKDEFYDIPDNYDSLTFDEKIKLYKKQLSENDLEDFKKELKEEYINVNKITKYSFFKLLAGNNVAVFSRLVDRTKNEFSKLIIEEIFYSDFDYMEASFYEEYNNHFIIFSKNFFNILNANIKKSSIMITLEENIDDFLSYDNNENIKPIFLKNIEDVNLLLDVLEQDIKKEKNRHIEKEEISTLSDIKIKNFFSIENLIIQNIEDKKEIYILGENGDGKTLLLQALTIALKGTQKDGQEKFREIENDFKLEISDSLGKKYDSKSTYKNMFAYGANRNNSCQMNEDETGYLTLFNNSLDLKNPITWLKTLDHSEAKGETNVISVAQAKELIKEILNKDVEIEISSTEVIFKEKGSPVEFDRLSAGYKGVITILCDLLVRLAENQPYITDINDYQGVVLIDEVELHLHPKWKYNFVKRLRKTFPLIQFIFTTHSPTVILGASKEAVFYKIYKEEGEVCISEQIKNEGYTNNSLITSPLFDLDTLSSRDLDNKDISSDDYIYSKIHKVVNEKIKDNININEDEILKLIDDELENYDKS